MSTRNRARKSTGPRSLRQRRSNQVSSTTRQDDSSDGSDVDMPTQRLNSTRRSKQSSSLLSPQASTSRIAVSDEEEQTTLRLSNGRRRIQVAESSSDTTSDSDEAHGRIEHTKKKDEPPKKKRIIRRNKSSSEEDEPSSSSRKVSQVTSTQNNQSTSHVLQPRNVSSLVNKCVYYLLIADQKKSLIKRKDILERVFSPPERKLFSEVLKEAGNVLKKTYGMEIIVSEKRKGEYMLINILNHDLNIQEFIDHSPSQLRKQGFLFYILTIIFMNEQSVTEDELMSALKPLNLDMNAKSLHPIFGDVRKYLGDLVKQCYLERNCINKEPPQFEFTWGERAYQEVDKKDLLEFACQVMGDTRPEEWILQHNDAMSRRQESDVQT